jgi:hypothetical protein
METISRSRGAYGADQGLANTGLAKRSFYGMKVLNDLGWPVY